MWQSLTNLFRGRWQMPLAVLATAVAAYSLYRLSPASEVLAPAEMFAQLEDLRARGADSAAADAAANLLDLQPPLPDDQQARLHGFLADLLHDRLTDSAEPSRTNAQTLLNELELGRKLGMPWTSARKLQEADGLRWTSRNVEAIAAYRRVHQDESVNAGAHRAIARNLISLLEGGKQTTAERESLLAEMLAEPDAPIEDVWWALQRALQIAFDARDLGTARTLLDAHGARLRTSDLKGYFDYLDAWVMVNEGRTTEATPLVYWIDEWLGAQPLRSDLLDSFGHLPAMNRWLLGRIHLAEDRPQQALLAFDEALQIQNTGPIFLAATIGRGQAFAALKQHDEATATFESAIARAAESTTFSRSLREFRAALLSLHETEMAERDYTPALAYLNLALRLAPPEDKSLRLELLEQLGESYVTAADAAADQADRRARFTAAGDALAAAADLALAEDIRKAVLRWGAAQAYDKAGANPPLRKTLHRFIAGRDQDPRFPAALLQLGQAYEAIGKFETALSYYNRLSTDFPKLGEAAQARLLSVGCLLSLGEERQPDAEAALHDLLEDDYIAPTAAVFHDGLLALCDLLYDQGRYGDAISRLEDFLERYPRDASQFRALFLLADSYRRSAYSLRELAAQDPAEASAAEGSRHRFREAVQRFRALRETLKTVAADARTPDAELYQELALLYEADCLAELNEPETIAAALSRYRQAAAEYEQTQTALIAQIQLANLHLRQGDRREAARALERCRWLLQGIPEAAFTRAADGFNRRDWENYLATLGASHLFRDVFAAR